MSDDRRVTEGGSEPAITVPNDYEPNLDDERIVELPADDEEPFAPPTIDAEERIEVEDDPDAAESEPEGP